MSEVKPTRASIAPPKKSFLPSSATGEAVQPADNMQAKSLTGMTFNVPKDWHTRFKVGATLHGLTMHEFLYKVFDEWEKDRKREGK